MVTMFSAFLVAFDGLPEVGLIYQPKLENNQNEYILCATWLVFSNLCQKMVYNVRKQKARLVWSKGLKKVFENLERQMITAKC